MRKLELEPIGIVKSPLRLKQESPRQGNLVEVGESYIELVAGNNYEQALEGLEEFERIWVIYQFHLNESWKPKVNVPRKTDSKLGVFATRSPYRPSSLGMSCVKLERIEGRSIYIAESDILNGSPVFDIKPYVDYCDSFQTKYPDWLQEAEEEEFKVVIPEFIRKRIDYLEKHSELNFYQFITTQLKYQPLNTQKKRVTVLEDREEGMKLAEIAFRTWRMQLEVDMSSRSIVITKLFTGYRMEELMDSDDDPYGDKKLHLKFQKKF
jgi:tRNA-Thr(GGU) m(6)t(6)A37 methyltransferase TsaA